MRVIVTPQASRTPALVPAISGLPLGLPFESTQEAWFWFIAAQEARVDGARHGAGKGVVLRPCEPLDILKLVDGLYRQRRLLREHLLVLRHYGRRRMAPDPRRVKEMRAHRLWTEALERIEPVLIRKGIVRLPAPVLSLVESLTAMEACA